MRTRTFPGDELDAADPLIVESLDLLIERWLAAGVTWTYVDEPTMILNGHRRGAPD